VSNSSKTSSADPLEGHPHHEYHPLRVARVVEETADACSVVFDIPDALRDAFRYEAGQFLTLRIPYQGKPLVRCYSLASSPVCEDEHKVTIKRVVDGRISNWINDHLNVGDTVDVLPPGGLFTLREGASPLLMFAGGSGITPVISIVKTALVCTSRTIKLVYANRDRDSVIFREELDALVAAHPDRLEVIHSLDAVDGYLDVPAITAHARGHEAGECYVCGPAVFMDLVEAGLHAVGVAENRIHIEKFVSPPDPDHLAEAQAAGAAELASSDVPEVLKIHLDGQVHEVPYERGQTVLVACQKARLEPPFSCTDGFCGCCMARLRAGQVRMINNDFLSEKELAAGWVLTCQSVPITRECEVEYPD